MRVLVVDDERNLREAICGLLESVGHITVGVSNGRDALERLKQPESPGVILLDLRMPVMDGWEFRRRQLDDDALAAIPVVVVTADSNALEKARRLGARGVLRKPFRAGELIDTVARICESRDGEL